MFKYLRTLNSSTPPTVIDTLPLNGQAIEDGYSLYEGTMVNVSFGEIEGNFTTENPMYLVIGVNKDRTIGKCIRLFPGMVIEGKLGSGIDLGVIEPGNFADINADGAGKGVAFTDGGKERFEWIDTSNKQNGIVSAVLL